MYHRQFVFNKHKRSKTVLIAENGLWYDCFRTDQDDHRLEYRLVCYYQKDNVIWIKFIKSMKSNNLNESL